jgi:hypothetical protein
VRNVAAAVAALVGMRAGARIAGTDDAAFGRLVAGAPAGAELEGRLSVAVDVLERVTGRGHAQLAQAWLHWRDPDLLGDTPLTRLERAPDDAQALRASADRFATAASGGVPSSSPGSREVPS